jgi:hypothetical protein
VPETDSQPTALPAISSMRSIPNTVAAVIELHLATDIAPPDCLPRQIGKGADDGGWIGDAAKLGPGSEAGEYML